jgi:chemotaxis protein MotB
MADEAVQPIIIIKKKGGHGGHHGGAWKVAYADFVTAMMALFIVLWLLSSSEKVQKAVGGYFQDPTGSGKLTGSNMSGVGETLSLSKDDMPALKEKLQQAVLDVPEFQKMKDQVQISVTGEGLRIELIETTKGMFFESGSSTPSGTGRDLLAMLAAELGKLPNIILLEGHTDAKPFGSGGTFTNWELSADRANAARRIMQSSGLRQDQVAQVRGYADQQLKNPEDPLDPRNRRISLIVQYRRPPGALEEADEEEEEETETPAAAHGEKAAKEKPAHEEKKPAHEEKKAAHAAAPATKAEKPKEKVQMGVFAAKH